MKRIILVFGLVLTGLALFGQSPRIRLNQITKDTLTGSVVLSGSDSNMVYSRNFFLNLTDSVLILFGDTLSTTATAFTGVATDLTLTGNGTVGTPLKVDTAIIATVSALADSLAGIISSVTTDLTLTGDGSVATPLKVDTAVIATIRAISDSLATLSFATLQDITDTLNLNTRDYITGLRLTDTLNTNSRGFLTQNQTITLTDDATGTGTTSISVTVVNDSHNHTISTLTGIQDSLNSKAALVHTHIISDVAFLQDSLDAKANDADLNNYLLTANYIVDSTRINATGDTAYYYQNGVLIGTGAIAGGGGGGSGTVTSITAGTFLSGGTITTSGTIALDTASAGLKTYISDNKGTVDLASGVTGTLPVANGGTGATTLTSGAFLKGNGTSAVSGSSNLTETNDTVFISKSLKVDSGGVFYDNTTKTLNVNATPDANYNLNVKNGTDVYANMQLRSDDTNGSSTIRARNNDTVTFKSIDVKTDGTALTGTVETSTNKFIRGETGQILTNNLDLFIMSNQSGKRLGLGTNNATRMIIQSNGDLQLFPETSGASSGNAISWNSADSTIYFSTSSIRFKENIRDYDKGISTLMQMKPVYFNYITSPQLEAGFIAEDVESIGLDEYTTKDGAGLIYGLRVGAFKPLIVKAIQEQQQIIETQQQEIETLKTQYNDLLQRIINLENK